MVNCCWIRLSRRATFFIRISCNSVGVSALSWFRKRVNSCRSRLGIVIASRTLDWTSWFASTACRLLAFPWYPILNSVRAKLMLRSDGHIPKIPHETLAAAMSKTIALRQRMERKFVQSGRPAFTRCGRIDYAPQANA